MVIASSLPERFFVTGTDTGVGKTVFCAMVLAMRGGSYWKPVQSGLEAITDTQSIIRMTGLKEHQILPETYCLSQPLSPHLAAQQDGVHIAMESFALPQLPAHERLIVEGAGGIMVPLTEDSFMLDLMERLALPVVLVARSTLGTINHTLLSLAALRSRGLEITGVVCNGPQNKPNCQAIETIGAVRVLAVMTPLKNLSPATLKKACKESFQAAQSGARPC